MHSLQPCQLGNDSLLNMFPIPPLGRCVEGPPFNTRLFDMHHRDPFLLVAGILINPAGVQTQVSGINVVPTVRIPYILAMRVRKYTWQGMSSIVRMDVS